MEVLKLSTNDCAEEPSTSVKNSKGCCRKVCPCSKRILQIDVSGRLPNECQTPYG